MCFSRVVYILLKSFPSILRLGSWLLTGAHTGSETIKIPSRSTHREGFEDKERDASDIAGLSLRARNLQIGRVMDVLRVRFGSNVADIGAGSGAGTIRAARRVGSSGKVYAVEINRNYLKYIEARAEREKLSNVRTVLGKEDDPLLLQQSVDAVLILKTLHEIAQPIRLLKRLRALTHLCSLNTRVALVKMTRCLRADCTPLQTRLQLLKLSCP